MCPLKMSWFKHRNSAPGWGSFAQGVCGTCNSRAHIAFLLMEAKTASICCCKFSHHNGWWMGLALCNFAGEFSLLVFFIRRSLWKQRGTFYIYAPTFILSIGFSESFMFCSMSKHLFPLKLYFIMLLWEMAVLFLLVGLVSHILNWLYVRDFFFF